jgi:hypothetical protein
MSNNHPSPSAPPLRDHLPNLPTVASTSSRRRNGKIARLPKSTRDSINLMLNDGLPYATILHKLGTRAHGLNVDNLSRWHAGGYQDWVKEQAWITELRARLDLASDILKEKGSENIHALSLRIAVSQLFGLLVTFEPSCLTKKFEDNPEHYLRLLHALAKLNTSAISYERLADSRKPLFSGLKL